MRRSLWFGSTRAITIVVLLLPLQLVILFTTLELGTSLLLSPDPLSVLLELHAPEIDYLKEICREYVGPAALNTAPYSNDVFFLRYCLAMPDNPEKQGLRLQQNLQWRLGRGKDICEAATRAIQQATTSKAWNNEPVLQAAPHASLISPYFAPAVITTTSAQDDLVYCIRAGFIDDVNLMKAVTIDQMVEFFLYTKEVNMQVANERSLLSSSNNGDDDLKCVITCNDLTGVKLVGGSADYRKALSQSANLSNDLYPSMQGPTLLVNLPPLLSTLVKLFTPLMSAETKARMKFEQGPLSKVQNLQTIASTATTTPERRIFVHELNDIVYNDVLLLQQRWQRQQPIITKKKDKSEITQKRSGDDEDQAQQQQQRSVMMMANTNNRMQDSSSSTLLSLDNDEQPLFSRSDQMEWQKQQSSPTTSETAASTTTTETSPQLWSEEKIQHVLNQLEKIHQQEIQLLQNTHQNQLQQLQEENELLQGQLRQQQQQQQPPKNGKKKRRWSRPWNQYGV